MTKTSTHGFGGSVAYSGKAYQRIFRIACSVYVFFLKLQGVPDACEQEIKNLSKVLPSF